MQGKNHLPQLHTCGDDFVQKCAKSGIGGATVAGPTDRVSTAILAQIRRSSHAASGADSLLQTTIFPGAQAFGISDYDTTNMMRLVAIAGPCSPVR